MASLEVLRQRTVKASVTSSHRCRELDPAENSLCGSFALVLALHHEMSEAHRLSSTRTRCLCCHRALLLPHNLSGVPYRHQDVLLFLRETCALPSILLCLLDFEPLVFEGLQSKRKVVQANAHAATATEMAKAVFPRIVSLATRGSRVFSRRTPHGFPRTSVSPVRSSSW